jgi:hypothetical protein
VVLQCLHAGAGGDALDAGGFVVAGRSQPFAVRREDESVAVAGVALEHMPDAVEASPTKWLVPTVSAGVPLP